MHSNKINLLITTYHLDHGGVEEVILTYAKLLDKERYSITVGCLNAGTVSAEIAKITGVRLVHIDTKNCINRFMRFVKLAREIDADIVHNHSCWYGLFAGILIGAHNVETVHNMYLWFTPVQKINYSLYSLLAHRIITVSEYVRKFTLDFFSFINPRKVTVIHNGIHYQQFLNKDYNLEIRSHHGIDNDEVVVGFVGRLTIQKGVTYLLDAAHRISKSHRNVRFVILGDGILRVGLESKAKQLQLQNVLFTGFQREVFKYLSMFDVFVLPSLYEGLPMSVLEAMASRKPVVATSVSGTAEVVVDNETGFLIEPKNVEQLTDRLLRLIEDPAVRRRMGESGQKRVIELFSAEEMIRKTEELYQTLLEKK